MTVSSYFTKLKSLWDRRDALCSIPACHCETWKEIISYVETQKTMKFLMGLNDSYATVRGNTLLLEPLPIVNKAYALVLCHEKQVEVSNGKSSIAQPEATVFAGHTFEFCRKRKVAAETEQSRPSKGNQVTAHDKKDAMPNFLFSQEDCKQILQLLNKSKSSFANQVGNSLNHEELSGPMLGEDDWDGN
ncbi:uncharacterized protein [Malus domestica]|uniref:uncharacterized protein n=1 Tax=Malus domestica TaxID=3750 RepID=UPI003976E706